MSWCSRIQCWAAIRKPPVPAAGSWITSPSRGCITATIASISGRGVKYCPAPDFFSSAFFCSNPSYRSPRPSWRALYQSSLSISSTSLFSVTGLRMKEVALAKISCTSSELPLLELPSSSSSSL